MGLGAGQIANDQDFTALIKGIVGRHSRGTAVSGVSTEVGYSRIDSIPIRAGYEYEVVLSPVNITVSTTTGMVGLVQLRVSTSGAATTASTKLSYYRQDQVTSSSQTNVSTIYGTYSATADGTLSVISTIQRANGSGTVGLYGSGNPGEAGILTVKEVGLTPADSGVDL